MGGETVAERPAATQSRRILSPTSALTDDGLSKDNVPRAEFRPITRPTFRYSAMERIMQAKRSTRFKGVVDGWETESKHRQVGDILRWRNRARHGVTSLCKNATERTSLRARRIDNISLQRKRFLSNCCNAVNNILVISINIMNMVLIYKFVYESSVEWIN